MRYSDDNDYLRSINCKNVNVIYTSYKHKQIRIREINGYHSLTDYCRFTNKLPHGYIRRKSFKWDIRFMKSDIPLYYTQNDDDVNLIGTWLHPDLIPNFLEWFNYRREN